MSNDQKSYRVTDQMISDAYKKIKKREFVNKLFGYSKSKNEMAKEVVRIIDEVVKED